MLKAQAEEKGLAEDVKFYLDFFRYGCPPHGGFGLGVDRLTMLLLGLSIKEVMFIFRGPTRLTPYPADRVHLGYRAHKSFLPVKC